MAPKIPTEPKIAQFRSIVSRDALIGESLFYAKILLYYVIVQNQKENLCAINIIRLKITDFEMLFSEFPYKIWVIIYLGVTFRATVCTPKSFLADFFLFLA